MSNTPFETRSWRKSSYSTAAEDSECVETAASPHVVAVRDSKLTPSPIHEFAPTSWTAFTATLKADHPQA